LPSWPGYGGKVSPTVRRVTVAQQRHDFQIASGSTSTPQRGNEGGDEERCPGSVGSSVKMSRSQSDVSQLDDESIDEVCDSLVSYFFSLSL